MSGLVPGAVALGANLGDPRATLRLARGQLETQLSSWGCPSVRFSRLWETAPVGPPQPAYLNAAVAFAAPTTLDPYVVLAFLLATERLHGRVRLERWGPRTLDLDLLFLGGHTFTSQDLTLPHPRAAERAFVLWPLVDADPDAQLPGHGAARPLAEALGREGVRPVTATDEPW